MKTKSIILAVFALAATLAGCLTPQQQSEITGIITNIVVTVRTNGPGPVVVSPTNDPGPVVSTNVVNVATNTPAPLPVNSAQAHAKMFSLAAGCPFKETINAIGTSALGWSTIHGKSWENDFREWWLDKMQAEGSDTLVYLVENSYHSAPVLAMCLADMQHPEDGRHMVPSEGWYDRSVAHGVTKHIAIMRDSPDTKVSISEAAVVELIAAYNGHRWKEVIYSTGLETKRNTSAADAARLVGWFRAHCKNRVIVGDQSPDYLLSVLALCDADAWLEQPTHPTQQPMTLAGLPAYLADLDRLAKYISGKRGSTIEAARLRVWAGEWLGADQATCREITSRILAAGFNCAGGGVYK